MATLDDAQLLQHAKRVEGKVIVLTGGANGIGRETAILFAQYGQASPYSVLSSSFTNLSQKPRGQNLCHSDAIYVQCNVLHWDDQVALFEQAVSQYGSVDVVITLAGTAERGSACSGVLEYKDGKPLPPDMSTLEVNLLGTLHTVHLALNYLRSTRTSSGQWKALILMGSMASWEAVPLAPMYTSSKYALRGLMRSLYPLMKRDAIRIACIDPVWADTQLLSTAARVVLLGSELLPVSRIAQTVLCAAADPDDTTSGCSWLMPDNGPILRLQRESIDEGTYKMINDRIARFKMYAVFRLLRRKILLIYFSLERDVKLIMRQVWRIFGKGIILFMGVVGVLLSGIIFGQRISL
ncbi:hypothetical protein DFH08DRAFT_686304 [Mycena albidolilacea]|uniref:NAD(P)-binding protein n=1 Tax=Mycena albidolilacea TaxID=1033008 RepID=A0AAD7AI94_9AGAR|nr:hypothetical protein DFH08DRAFT_686304 [Mycena albidolilacea]